MLAEVDEYESADSPRLTVAGEETFTRRTAHLTSTRQSYTVQLSRAYFRWVSYTVQLSDTFSH